MPTDDELRHFGNTLRAARQKAGLSLDRLADELKARGQRTTGANIGAWERGQYAPRTRELVDAIDGVLEMGGRLHDAIGWVHSGDSTEDYNSRIIKLPPSAQQFIDEYIANEERKQGS